MPGWLDRLDDLWDAGFELGRTNVNVALDIATAPFTDDEYEGFFGTVAGISMDYASESMQHLIGPEGLGGVAIGALPPAVRRGGNDTLHALEWAYREGVGEPLSTAFTAGSLLEARGRGDDLSGFFDRDLWSEAYGIAQTRSPGQAFTLMFASSENNNILDDEWRIGVEGTRWFSTVSGILDFGARIYLDPTFLGTKVALAGRAYREGARVVQYFNEGGGFGRFADDVENLVGPGSAAARMADDAARMAADATNVVSMSRAFRMADDAARMVDDAAAAAAGAAKPLIEALDNLSKEYPSYYFTSDDEGRALYAQFLEHPDRYGTPTAPIVSAIDLSDDLAHPIAYFEGASDDAVRNLRTEEGFRPATTKPSGAPEPIFGTVVYHGARNADLGNYIDPETGELVLRAASNFEGRTSSVSFTDSLDTAWDYSTRVPAGGGARMDGLIFEIDEAAPVFDELLLVRESGEELAVNFPVPHDPLSEVRIPKEQFRVISTGTADDAAERSARLVRSREEMARLSDEELAGWYSGLLEHEEMLEFRGGGGDPTDWDRNRIYGEIWRRFSRDAPAAPAAAPAAGAAGWGGPGAARVHPAFSSKQWGDLTESVPIEFFDDMQGNPGVLAGEVTGGAAGSHRARVDDLVESIREEGIQEPLMLEYNPESGAVWLGEGNHRLAAARELGLDSVPVRAVRHDPLPRGDRLAGKKLHSYGVDEFGDAINASGERLGSAFAPSDVGVPTGVAVPPSGPVAAAAVAAGARSEGVEQLAGRIREKYFPNHGDGDLIAYELAQAVLGEGGYVGGRNSMENVMRFFMGHTGAIRRVFEESPAIATRYSRFLKEALKIEEAVPSGTVGHNARTFQQALDDVPLEMIDEINEPHVTGLYKSIDEAIRPTVRRNIIDRVNTSVWYRSHWSMAPVRLVRDMRPQHIVWAGDANSGEQVVRLMQEAGRHPDDITRFRGRWAGAERRERVHIFQEEQANMVDDLLKRHFPDADESVRAALRQDFVESSAAADRALSTAQRYDAQLSTVAVPQADGSIQMFQVPMTPGQLEQSFTMVDIKTLDRFLGRRASIIPDGVFSGLETAGAWMNGTMGVWKAGALLRPAWTVRVVLDEQLRMIAKMGAWTRMHGILANDRHRYVEAVLARKVVKDGVVDRGSAAWLRSRRAAVAGGVGALLAGPAGAAIGAGASFVRNRRAIRRLTRKLEVKRAAREIGGRAGQARLADDSLTAHGEAPSQIGAHEVQGAFGDAVAPQVVWERSVSANRQVSFALGHEERALYDELRTTYGSWVEVNPLEFRADEFSERVSRYGEGWERVVNDQYASNQAGRIAFDDSLGGPQERVDRLIEWADTDKGRQFVAATPKRFPTDEFGVFAPADVEDWAKKLVEAADRMVLDRTIRGRLAAGERVRFADVQAIAGDAGQDWRYLVGEIHAQDMVAAKGGLKGPLDRLRGFTEKAFERLGTLPTDTLSRNPYFRHVYETGMERRLKSLDAADLRIHGQQYELSDEALRGMENSARREALQETRYLLYDLAESSQFAHMFRHMMPFYNAWQEVLSRWAGIAIENPAYVARLGVGLRADIDIDGFMETVEVDGERFYQFRLPEFATSLLSSGFFSGAANDLGIVRFRADSLNMVTQGLPGFGPMAQVPASMLVTEQPELEGALRFVLPYGPIKGTNIVEQAYESFKPAWLKRITSSLQEDESYESMAAKIMISRLADMQNGEREQIDFDDANVRAEFIAEVRTDAQHFMYLRAMASAVSPAAIGFHSPYQPWIDRHRELRSANPVTADEEFLKELTREGVGGFFVMSARFSKNNEGLPATLESEELRNKYIDLVRRYPEVGGLILGIEGGGAARFSSSVYEKQLAEDTSPGSGKKRRERLSLDEIMVSAREREGWSKYGEVSDVVYNEMRRRGLPNLRVKEARDLLWVKQVSVLKLGEEYPLWYAAFRDPDLTKWSDRLEGMRAVVSDERLSGRDDVRLLAEYLEIRDLFTGELLRRGVAGGAVTLEATSNMDLSGVWEQVMDQLSENPTFSDLLWRWLEFDPLKSETWPTRQRTALQASRLARMAA